MPLTSQQKLLIMRKAENNPTLAFMELVKILESQIQDQVNSLVEEKLKEIDKKTDKIVLLKKLDNLKGDKGDSIKGDKGEPGRDYILTEQDKKHIASLVKIPVLQQIVEKQQIVKERPVITQLKRTINQIKEVAKYESPDEIARKINSKEGLIDLKSIKGLENYLKNIQRSMRDKSGISKGGMGNVVPETFAINSSTTSITLANNVASNGRAIWFNYQGQQQAYGTHFTVSGNIVTLLFTPDDGSYADIIYIRT